MSGNFNFTYRVQKPAFGVYFTTSKTKTARNNLARNPNLRTDLEEAVTTHNTNETNGITAEIIDIFPAQPQSHNSYPLGIGIKAMVGREETLVRGRAAIDDGTIIPAEPVDSVLRKLDAKITQKESTRERIQQHIDKTKTELDEAKSRVQELEGRLSKLENTYKNINGE